MARAARLLSRKEVYAGSNPVGVSIDAAVAKLVTAPDLDSGGLPALRVRIPSAAPNIQLGLYKDFSAPHEKMEALVQGDLPSHGVVIL